MKIHKNFLTTIALWCTLLGMIWCLGTPQVFAVVVPIPDLNLRAALHDALGTGRTADDIEDTELATLTRLIVNGKGKADGEKITNLTGLGSATNLTHLNLVNNRIADISALSGLTSLTHLHLGRNRLVDDTALTTVGEIKILQIYRKGTTTPMPDSGAGSVLHPLRNLTSLQELNLSHNSIAAINALKNMRSLSGLALQHNQIADLSPIVNRALMPTRTSNNDGTYSWGNSPRGGSDTGLPSGAKVWVGGNLFSDTGTEVYFSILVGTQGVTVFSTFGEVVYFPDPDLRDILRAAAAPFVITSDWLNELSAASETDGTSSIWLSDSDPDTQPTLNLQQLRNIVEREPLTKSMLRRIRTLNLSVDDRGYQVQELAGLDHCTNLEGLLLSGNYLSGSQDYEIIGRLTKLKVLDLSYQDAFAEEDIYAPEGAALKFLENLTELRTLNLSNNWIGSIKPLLKLTALEVLDLRSNDISSMPNDIKNWTNLRELYLGDNSLTPLTANVYNQETGNFEPYLTGARHYVHNTPMTAALQDLANRPNGLITDMLIVKNVEFVEPFYAYGPEGFVHIKVTFNLPVAYNETSAAFHNGRPYLVLRVDDEVADGSDIAHPAHWIVPGALEYSEIIDPNDPNRPAIQKPVDPATGEELTGDALEEIWYRRDRANLPPEGRVDLGETVEFAYFLPPGRSPEEVRVEYLGGSPLVYEVPAISTEDPIQQETYLITRDWFEVFPRMMKPVIITPPTVQMSRAGGETGTATGDFDVEITFSGPLVEPSAAALASKISFGDVVGLSVGSLTRRQPVYYYSPETWTLSVAVAAGVSGDVTVTLDPEGLSDAADPGNPVAAEGSTLSVTVPVDRPQDVPETVETTDVASVGSSLEFPISFLEDGVTYEGTAKPYITIYVGERVAANERNAVWARAEDVNSTLVTFTYEIGAGDLASSVSLKTEEGISIPTGTTFVSETLRVEGEDPPASGPGETPRKSSTQDGAAEPVAGNLSLTSVGGSTRVSLRAAIAVPTVLEIRQEIAGIVYIPETAEETKTGASSVPRSPIVFNELGNGSGDANDWLEFRNVTGSAVSLKDWQLSVVQDGKKEDTSLIAFEEDVSVPANGLLLVVNTSPDKTSLAAGKDIAGSGKNGGLTHLYLVDSGLSLPDDGKFLLILRNAKEKLGKDEAFVDVAGGGGSGTDAFVREQAGTYDTHVWPLQVRDAPGGDTEEALGSGKVWQRAKADIVGYHKDAWAQASFTGLGYDRKVSDSAATAGTPGYPNGAVKTEASTPKGSITISEVMFDSGGGKLPQWVELYNKSKTEAINLNRWQLEIQNVVSQDLVGRPIVTLTLGEKVIQPNQTLLIVSGPGRASSGSSSLPAERVYDLLALHAKNLRIKKSQDTFLSAIGFYLKLSDRNGTKIDEVGNTDGNRRTADAPAWALPVSPEEGVRSSLIRRYTKGTSTAEDGMERGNWVLAANVKQSIDTELHWGDADDIGTPGYRGGGPLPVELSSFAVKRAEAGAVVVTWTTESEVDNAGFNLRRSEKRESGFMLLNPALIAGAGTTGERQAYTFTDTSAKPGVEYYYQIEEVAFDGRPVTLVTRFLPGPVSASNRMLTTFGAVKQQRD